MLPTNLCYIDYSTTIWYELLSDGSIRREVCGERLFGVLKV